MRWYTCGMKSISPSKEFQENFANEHGIYQSKVSLFERSKNLIVETKLFGRNERKILKRSNEMEELVIRETNILVSDWEKGNRCFDGLIYNA